MLRPDGSGWRLVVEPVGEPGTLLERLGAAAGGDAVALGIDCPIGLPRAYVARHATETGFLEFLGGLAGRPGWFEVAETLAEVGGARPFYPRRGARGMTRAGHATALGFGAAGLCRACDRATTERPAGAPMFWTLGANQSGKAAISAWREVLLPALGGQMAVWPFEGPFRALLRPGWVTVGEAYPADAMRQVGVRLGVASGGGGTGWGRRRGCWRRWSGWGWGGVRGW